MLPPRGERGAVEAEALGVDSAPVELRRQEGRFGDRIGNLRRPLGIGELGEAREFLAASLRRTASASSPSKSQKNGNGCADRPLLAHEQHRRLRQEEIDARERAHGRRRSERVQPLAEGAVADLVVVLNERDEGAGRKVRARPAARRPAIGRDFALIGEAFGQRPGRGASSPHNRRNSRSFRASRRRAARGGRRRSTAPCRGGACARGGRAAAARCSRSRAGDGPVAPKRERSRAASLVDDVGTAVVLDRMHRVKAQSVEMERVDPVFRVLDDEVADGTRVGPVEIDRPRPKASDGGVVKKSGA